MLKDVENELKNPRKTKTIDIKEIQKSRIVEFEKLFDGVI